MTSEKSYFVAELLPKAARVGQAEGAAVDFSLLSKLPTGLYYTENFAGQHYIIFVDAKVPMYSMLTINADQWASRVQNSDLLPGQPAQVAGMVSEKFAIAQLESITTLIATVQRGR